MIIVSGWLQVAPSRRAEFLSGCREVVEQARAADGCLDFALSADLLEPGRINVYERWASDAQLTAFRGAGPDPDHAAKILASEVSRYRVSAAEAA
ncbi:putative quinol monooxygenase [Streptomyces gilvosporeus]|uniref:Antibiotic biosynthesis monooxygenase n=1 Tax=Streptomyces gilvosporeus TaxID=553510 RepID=A0A1V0TMP8_9ACTN|nr:antibiotic biosynthesis monooxygenase [Streptomyces gilvosporeus]ARF54197.1 antibiotic biosynthesis monooxygenase [Streptomyces gilvosporeus]